MIRRDQDGMDINVYIDMYELPAELMKEGTETNVIEVFRKIAKDYLATAEGKRELEYNCGYFIQKLQKRNGARVLVSVLLHSL